MPDFNTVPAVNAAYFFNMRHILMCAGFYVVVNFAPDLLNYSAPNFISHASRFTRRIFDDAFFLFGRGIFGKSQP